MTCSVRTADMMRKGMEYAADFDLVALTIAKTRWLWSYE